ncbi:hypothetical protein [Winogradskyella immobilis]|uniref:Uncharacterized protein n=1 Tax=Winogradskyella immobilis TaxID=2816852 RepID=A0ABS8EN77_9FLAO|nr:hypothetical protein [Winogradskyella immobilis]MCC1484560.1 hypothetical protein [Winogradskyella immobilis]MCG0016652.1 hypothetical protein [Winogradskyella immobilis]
MKIKIILFSLLLAVNIGFAQKKKDPKSIIDRDVSISKYHSLDDLQSMKKGELLVLYRERIQSIVKILPYIAFATKPGVTMSTLGIPDNNDNKKTLVKQHKASDEFLENTLDFQSVILPYSDTDKLIAAILFYEETLKSLHEYNDFN